MSGHATLTLHRGANVFAERQDLRAKLEKDRQVVRLAPDQILHPVVPSTYLVRLGNLRVSELLPDGREITRAVLQAGALFELEANARDAAPADDVYILSDLILMALGESKLWLLPHGL